MDFGKWLAQSFSYIVHCSELLLESMHETAEIPFKFTTAGY